MKSKNSSESEKEKDTKNSGRSGNAGPYYFWLGIEAEQYREDD
jgi:hypothetical protein